MGTLRAVIITCDQTGQELVIRHGDKLGISEHGYAKRFDFGGAATTKAWEHAATLGWRSFSLRDHNGEYFELPAPIPYAKRWTPGAHVVAPGVDPDPPYSVVAKNQIARWKRVASLEAAGDAQAEIARLTAEIERLRATAAADL